MKIKNFKLKIAFSLLFLFSLYFFSFLFLLPHTAHAAFFRLEPSTRSGAPGDTFSVDVIIDTENAVVTSADALLDFNATVFEVSSITPGTFFPQTFQTSSASEIYIGGAVENATETRQGVGTLSTINFRAIGSGTSQVTFDCTAGKTSDSNITREDRNATDIIECDKNVDGTYSVSGQVTGVQPTPTGSVQLTPSPTPRELPQAGNIQNTIIIGGIGTLVVIAGMILLM